MNRREAIKSIAGAGTAAAAAVVLPARSAVASTTQPLEAKPPSAAAHPAISKNGLEFWLESSLNRVYPTSTAAEVSPVAGASLSLNSCRNYRLSFQACFRNTRTSSAKVKCEITGLEGIEARIRRVGFVPMQHLDTHTPFDELDGIGKIPGLCPDPLWPDDSAHIGPQETGIFWISLYVPEGMPAGSAKGAVRITLEDRFGYMSYENPDPWSQELPFTVHVHDLVVKRRENFPVTNWISADSIWEYYHIEPFSERFWELADAYIGNIVEHGVDVVYTPIFNIRAEKLKRPAQLLKVEKTGPDSYKFDFSDLRRWIQLAKKNDANWIEFSHFFSPAPESAAYPQKIYHRGDTIGDLLWPANTPATSDTYRKFLTQFLPQFKRVLEEEGMLDKSLFHLADEPDGDAAMDRYREARAMLKELAPWIKVMDAMSDPRFATERLSDMPVPSIVTANQFTKAGCPAWAYFCCGPRAGYLQRLLDTPLHKIRMAGWLFYRLGAKGFLHWGYNYWFKFCTDQIGDPFQDASNGAWPGMPYGDTFAVYPGADGPIDSIRWEIFAESLQDYALLQAAGVEPDDAMLAGIRDYNDFPKSVEWIDQAVARLMSPNK